MYNLSGRIITFLCLYLFTSATSFAADEISFFTNTKEAQSQIIPQHKINYYTKQIETYKNELQLLQRRLQGIAHNQNVCEEDVIKAIDLEIPGSKFEEKVHIARFAQVIDNITESIILKFPYQYFLGLENDGHGVDNSQINWPQETSQNLILAFSRLNEDILGHNCWGRALINLTKKINTDKENKFKHKRNLNQLYQDAYIAGAITQDTKNHLVYLTKSNIHNSSLTLSEYIEKIKSIQQQFSEAGQTSPANLPSKRLKLTSAQTYRDQFIKKYDLIQIALMRKTLVNMRARFESNQIEIHIFNDLQENTEIIPLDPMERYRFVVKLFRKEWDSLKNHSSFKGVNIEYTDFLLAGFETGLIAAEELDQLIKLEELWNPHKPWWEKALYWGTTIGGSLASLIPPPYGYIAILGIVVIEGVAEQVKQKGGLSETQTHSLF